MNTKLRIDLATGVIEVEGEETFVTKIYDDFKDKVASSNVRNRETATTPKGSEEREARSRAPRDTTASGSTPIKRKSGGGKEMPSLIKSLDLSARDGKPSLNDFYGGYQPKSNYERNLIFVYYLAQVREIPESVTEGHVFTCYRHLSQKIPEAFSQSLWDTGSKKGWLDTSSLEDIKLTTLGINHLEHAMVKAE
ncbi:MAG: hypothetical protein M3441_20695 [Chloroflexota bacterium]|nr:hypothetical protein [Chloroflexota bacterium]